jgi:hypothetical protein
MAYAVSQHQEAWHCAASERGRLARKLGPRTAGFLLRAGRPRSELGSVVWGGTKSPCKKF